MNTIFKQIFEAVGTTQAEAGKIIGRNPKLMNDRMVRGTLRYKEFFQLLDGLGVELSYVAMDSGNVVKPEHDKDLETLIDYSKSTIEKVGKIIGKPPKKFKERIDDDIFRAREFLQIVEALGFETKYTIKATGEVLSLKAARQGHKVVGVVRGVKYNTLQSRPVSNDFYADGENKYHNGRASELYITEDGRYFLVDYFSWENVPEHIIPLVEKDALEYIKANGYID